ncbi:replication initiation protein [Natronospirillum operosum]|uniref:Replication initiation protein n=2 Tax=Natronospirillum operosum TaxID=2759953 RepID=A0A4Z0WFA2_9GAMM|nr:replication initiation protein [Natronospirillum operosum]
MKNVLAITAVSALLLFGCAFWGNDILRLLESSTPSTSIGPVNDGRLIHGKRLPSSGPNFQTYSRLGSTLGRTAVHSRVRDAMLAAYAELEQGTPGVQYVYGETGWPWGGRFRPHRTHQNGLSVDFMVPVTHNGEPIALPTSPFNKFGYALQFDSNGRSGNLQVDFDSMAAHLDVMDRVAREHGLRIDLVVFAPDLQERLFESDPGSTLQSRLRFNVNPSWVRHDDHYHVDFAMVDD